MASKGTPINSTKAPYPMTPGSKLITYDGDRKARKGSAVKTNPIPKNAIKGSK